MKRRLTVPEALSVTSMLFGLFFGAGNLIFPAYMGQAAGRNMLPALLGFLISGVGLPLLAVAALGITHSDGVLQLSAKVGKGYSYFFTCALYLTIGPFFAIPRCFTVPFETGVAPVVPASVPPRLALFLFTLFFFALMLWFSLRPGKILVWVGKLLNPMFLLVFAWIMVTALLYPLGSAAAAAPVPEYTAAPLAKGILEGYNTMDALAGLAFGIVVVNVITSLGVKEPNDVAVCTVQSGALTCLLMALIYGVTVVVGAQSRGAYPVAENGGAALATIARHYFPGVGAYLFAAMIFFACLKTAVGLITSCSQTFERMFPGKLSYRKWVVLFSTASLAFANVGLTGIIKLSIPVLMMLYPLAMTLILLSLTERFFGGAPLVYRLVTVFALVCACGDFLAALPGEVRLALHLDGLIAVFGRVLPFFDLGLGWVCPALLAFCLALLLRRKKSA